MAKKPINLFDFEPPKINMSEVKPKGYCTGCRKGIWNEKMPEEWCCQCENPVIVDSLQKLEKL